MRLSLPVLARTLRTWLAAVSSPTWVGSHVPHATRTAVAYGSKIGRLLGDALDPVR